MLAGAGVVAGAVGTAGGVTSLVSYPALLAAGLAPLPASVTNIVASVACLPGSALASRPELRGRARWLLPWAGVAMAGGVGGAALLVSTSPGAFAHVVPFLLLIAAASLLLQPRISSWRDRRRPKHGGLALPFGVLATSLYNGYFGAGSGVMTLALLMVTVDREVARANALKNVLVGVSSVASAVAFIVLGRAEWGATAALALGLFAGSTLGPALARRAPAGLLRWLVALTGLGLAVRLWVKPG